MPFNLHWASIGFLWHYVQQLNTRNPIWCKALQIVSFSCLSLRGLTAWYMVIVGKSMWVFTCCNSVQLIWEADMSDPKLCLHTGKFWLYILVLNFASLAMNGNFLHHVELLVQCTHWANGWSKGEHRQPFLHNGCKYQLWSSSSVCMLSTEASLSFSVSLLLLHDSFTLLYVEENWLKGSI